MCLFWSKKNLLSSVLCFLDIIMIDMIIKMVFIILIFIDKVIYIIDINNIFCICVCKFVN